MFGKGKGKFKVDLPVLRCSAILDKSIKAYSTDLEQKT